MKSIKKLTLQKQTVRSLNLRSGIKTGPRGSIVTVTADSEACPSGAHKQCSAQGVPSCDMQ